MAAASITGIVGAPSAPEAAGDAERRESETAAEAAALPQSSSAPFTSSEIAMSVAAASSLP